MGMCLVVGWPCALNILGFTLGTILEMRESTWGFSLGFITWKKMYVCICINICIQIYMYICVCVCLHIYIHTYVYTHTHTHINIYLYIYIYTYTYIHTYIFFHVTKLRENPRVLPPILRVVPRVNPRIFRAQGHSTIRLEAITIIYSLRAQHVT
jgi:hypothetical protein